VRYDGTPISRGVSDDSWASLIISDRFLVSSSKVGILTSFPSLMFPFGTLWLPCCTCALPSPNLPDFGGLEGDWKRSLLWEDGLIGWLADEGVTSLPSFEFCVSPEATQFRGDGRGGAFLKPDLAPAVTLANEGLLPRPVVEGICVVSWFPPRVLLLFLVPELLVVPLLDVTLYGSACART
jgi:hypothetical protein